MWYDRAGDSKTMLAFVEILIFEQPLLGTVEAL